MICTTSIPAKPYVRATIYKLFGQPAYITPNTNFGKYFNLLLVDNSRAYDNMYKGYSDKIEVIIPEYTFKRKGLSISGKQGYCLTHTNIIALNNFVEEYIKKEMFVYIDALLEASRLKFFDLTKITIMEAIELAQEKFSFDEETFQVEAIRKAYYRYCKRKAFGIQ